MKNLLSLALIIIFTVAAIASTETFKGTETKTYTADDLVAYKEHVEQRVHFMRSAHKSIAEIDNYIAVSRDTANTMFANCDACRQQVVIKVRIAELIRRSGSEQEVAELQGKYETVRAAYLAEQR